MVFCVNYNRIFFQYPWDTNNLGSIFLLTHDVIVISSFIYEPNDRILKWT